MSEAKRMGAYDVEYGPDDHALQVQKELNRTSDLYGDAKRADKGATVRCPTCEKLFVKKTKQQAFCRNKGRGNCKDRYHNRTNPRFGTPLARDRLVRSGKVSSYNPLYDGERYDDGEYDGPFCC